MAADCFPGSGVVLTNPYYSNSSLSLYFKAELVSCRCRPTTLLLPSSFELLGEVSSMDFLVELGGLLSTNIVSCLLTCFGSSLLSIKLKVFVESGILIFCCLDTLNTLSINKARSKEVLLL